MSNSTESPMSVSFKTQRGTLITVRGDDHEELIERLASASLPVGPDQTSLLEMIGSIDAALGGGAGTAQGQQHGAHEAPQQAQGSLNPPCPDCNGPTKERSGTGKRGPWRAYFCDTKGHSVRDADTGKLWGK